MYHNLEQQHQLLELATPIIPSHFHPTVPPYIPLQRLETPTQWTVYNEPKMRRYPCYIPPQTPPCTFDALTSSPGIFYETPMHHASCNSLRLAPQCTAFTYCKNDPTLEPFYCRLPFKLCNGNSFMQVQVHSCISTGGCILLPRESGIKIQALDILQRSQGWYC